MASEAQTGYVPIQIVPAKPLDEPISLIAQFVNRNVFKRPRIKRTTRCCIGKFRDVPATVGENKVCPKRAKVVFRNRNKYGLGIIEER